MFLAWIKDGILEGGNGDMSERSISDGELKPAIGKIARPWYKNRLSKVEQG